MNLKTFLTCFLLFFLSVSVSAITLDESPAKPEEWGYRPADGTTTDLNPPGFSWRPVKEAAQYIVQVATDDAFANVIHTCDTIPWSAYCPPEPLPQGKLYWRYAAKDKEGNQSAWSQTRAFTIPADAVVFPKPTIEQLVQRMPAEHPRLFFRPEDIPHLRELAAGPLAKRWNDIQKQADKVLAEPPDISDPPKYPEGMERLSGEWKKMWWGNRQRMIDVVDGAAVLGFAYRITGDEKYALAARDLLLAMTKWDLNGSTNYSYNDEAAMPALYMGSRAYTWARPVFSDADAAAITAMMRVRGQQAFDSLRKRDHLWRPYSSHHNRSWHFLGELAIAFHGDIPEADTWLDYVMTVMYTAYPVWGDADGGWHEGISYWSSYTDRFMYWAFVIRSAFGINAFDRPFYHRVGDFAMYTLPPGSQAGAFGDLASGTKSSNVAPLMAILASGAQNPYWKWYADTCGASLPGGYLGFLYAANSTDLAPKPPSDLPSSVAFRGVGIAVLNTNLLDAKDDIQIDFKSSPMGRQSHGYNANNAFVLNKGGQRVFTRSGERDVHGSPHHQEWMWESKSDNAILVNGKGQIKHSPAATGFISAFATSPAIDVVVGEAAKSYKDLERWTRRIVFFKPNAILIHDVLDAPEPSTFQWTLHAIGEFTLGDQEVSWTGEPGSARVRFLEPAGLKLGQTDQYSTPPHEWAKFSFHEWHLTAASEEPVKHREFLTLITLDGLDTQERVAKTDNGGIQVILTLPTGEATVQLRPDSFKVTAPGFEQSF